MELEDLKNIWKNSGAVFQPKGETEIATMLKRRSLSAVDKLKRSIWFEILFTLMISLGLLIYALSLPPGALKWTSIAIILMCLVYSVFYVKKLVLLNRFDPAKENIRGNLISLINNLSSYLKFYRRSYTILYPVYFCIGLLFGGLERGAGEFLINLAKPQTIIYLILMAILFYFLSTKFTDWYLKKLYGNHLEKLKSILDDLQE
ncbi:MAG: hypothetical protein OEW40_06340 [Cyclobacteriaceae bacterium]|nr:hypothetical protein [Cyclobacteriaceae bacterium]